MCVCVCVWDLNQLIIGRSATEVKWSTGTRSSDGSEREREWNGYINRKVVRYWPKRPLPLPLQTNDDDGRKRVLFPKDKLSLRVRESITSLDVGLVRAIYCLPLIS